MNDKTKIAGLKNIGQWKALKCQIQSNPKDISKWEEAFTSFLLERINTRYFEPIEAIEKITKSYGKGFSIVAIYCSLIEFFEMLKNGYEFHHPKYLDSKGLVVKSTTNFNKKGIGMPLKTKEIFVNFLTKNSPFDQEFTEDISESFYYNVRCSILHEAETKSNWIVKDGIENGKIINLNLANETCLNWKPLKRAFNIYLVENYKIELLTNKNTQDNFIFKWDKLCNI